MNPDQQRLPIEVGKGQARNKWRGGFAELD